MGTPSFCSFCGGKHLNEDWPRRCSRCSELSYGNPVPVVIALVPIAMHGLLGVRRGIEPARGRIALPGGYLNRSEPWLAGVARELDEETGVKLETNDFSLFAVCDTPAQVNVLVIVGLSRVTLHEPVVLKANDEVLELVLITPKNVHELAWDTHRLLAERYFAEAGIV
jgi:ADP-ribose pyrophosphatase YjhB (NUDIX family)